MCCYGDPKVSHIGIKVKFVDSKDLEGNGDLAIENTYCIVESGQNDNPKRMGTPVY